MEQDGTRTPAHTPLLGELNVANALAATVTARLAGFSQDAIVAGLAALAAVPGRLERVASGQPFDVLVDYAHTPDALAAALAAACQLAGAHRVIVVFGAGGDRDAEKRPLMGRVAADVADLVIVTNDNPRSEDPASSPTPSWPARPTDRPGHSVSSTAGPRSATGLAPRNPATSCSSPARATRPSSASATAPSASTTGSSSTRSSGAGRGTDR